MSIYWKENSPIQKRTFGQFQGVHPLVITCCTVFVRLNSIVIGSAWPSTPAHTNCVKWGRALFKTLSRLPALFSFALTHPVVYMTDSKKLQVKKKKWRATQHSQLQNHAARGKTLNIKSWNGNNHFSWPFGALWGFWGKFWGCVTMAFIQWKMGLNAGHVRKKMWPTLAIISR